MNRIKALAEWLKNKSSEFADKRYGQFEANPVYVCGLIYAEYIYQNNISRFTFDPFTQTEVKAALEMALRPEPLPDMAARLGRIREAALRLQAELTVLLETLEE